MDQENDRVSDDTLRYHSDPFFNECRAYGRLQEKSLNGKIAVRCYGYITVPAETEIQLERQFQITDWDRPEEEYERPVSERQPLRALVKDLVRNDLPLTSKVADKILRDTKRMRRCGVYPGDIRPRNYKNGLLVDFSIARTEPYFLFEIRHAKQVERMKNSDLYMWEEMVEENKLRPSLRAIRNEKYCANLRPRKKETTIK